MRMMQKNFQTKIKTMIIITFNQLGIMIIIQENKHEDLNEIKKSTWHIKIEFSKHIYLRKVKPN